MMVPDSALVVTASTQWTDLNVVEMRVLVARMLSEHGFSYRKLAGHYVSVSTLHRFVNNADCTVGDKTLDHIEEAVTAAMGTPVTQADRTGVTRLTALEGQIFRLGILETRSTITEAAKIIGVSRTALHHGLRGDRPIPVARLHTVVPPPLMHHSPVPTEIAVATQGLAKVDGLAVVSDARIPLPASWRALVPGLPVPWENTGLWLRAAKQNDIGARRRNLPFGKVYEILETRRRPALAKICDGPLKPNVGARRIMIHGGCLPKYKDIARYLVGQFSSPSRQLVECDIAIDLDVSFAEILSFVPNRRRFRRTDVIRNSKGPYADGKPNYRRHGSPSASHFTVYDKRSERAARGRTLPATYEHWRDVTRCEYRLRLQEPTDSLEALGALLAKDFNEIRLLSLGAAAQTWTARERCLLRAVWEMGTERPAPSMKRYLERCKQRRQKRGRCRGYFVEDAIIECALASSRSEALAVEFAQDVHGELHKRLEQLPDTTLPLGDWLAARNGEWQRVLLPVLSYVTGLPI